MRWLWTCPVAADNDGKVHGVRARVLVDQGAHTLGPTSAGLEPMTTGQSIVGPYRIDNFECNSYGVLTNKCPGAAYRGVGTVQGVFVIERVMDMLADELGLDPVDVRMKNFIQPQDQPFNTSAGRLYDSGDYPETLAKVLEVSNYRRLREEQAEARSRGEQVGIGICCFVEHSSTGSQDYIKRGVYGLPAFDSATIRVDAGGNVLAAVSAKSTGQSHDSVFAILVARELGVPYETVKILEGDTDATPFGSGTGVSRSAVSTGGAIRLAAQDIRRKATEIARFFLETEKEELQVEDGQIFDPEDPTKTVSFAAVAAAAHDASRIVSLPRNIERGLQSTRTFDPPHQTFGHGAHLAVTRIDPETGMVKVEQYFCVEDCGTIIDPRDSRRAGRGSGCLGHWQCAARGTRVQRRRAVADLHLYGLPGAHCTRRSGDSDPAYGDSVGGRHCRCFHGGGQRSGRRPVAAGCGGHGTAHRTTTGVGDDPEREQIGPELRIVAATVGRL